jgi:hypothetical protein
VKRLRQHLFDRSAVDVVDDARPGGAELMMVFERFIAADEARSSPLGAE